MVGGRAHTFTRAQNCCWGPDFPFLWHHPWVRTQRPPASPPLSWSQYRTAGSPEQPLLSWEALVPSSFSRSSSELTLAALIWCREFITWCDSPSESGTKKLSFATQKCAEVPQTGWGQHRGERDLHMGHMPSAAMPSVWVRRWTYSRSSWGRPGRKTERHGCMLPRLPLSPHTHTHTQSHHLWGDFGSQCGHTLDPTLIHQDRTTFSWYASTFPKIILWALTKECSGMKRCYWKAPQGTKDSKSPWEISQQ